MIGAPGVSRWFANPAVLVPSIASILCSLYMTISLLLARRKAVTLSAQIFWTSNTKDAFLGVASSADRGRLSWLGRCRTSPLRKRDVSMFMYFWVVYIPKMLFRRIRSVTLGILQTHPTDESISELDRSKPRDSRSFRIFVRFCL